MNESVSTQSNSESGWLQFAKVTGFALILGGLVCSVIAALWFTGDFIATSVTSPNLSNDAQVSDFNDFGYIGESLSSSRFTIGVLVLVMSIAVIIQGLLLITREGKASSLFVAGGVALAAQALFLMTAFYLPVFLVFLLTAAGLYLATEWSRLRRVSAEIEETPDGDFYSQDLLDPETGSPGDYGSSLDTTSLEKPNKPELDTKSELETIPTLVDEIETEDLTSDAFASEAAYLSGVEPTREIRNESGLAADRDAVQAPTPEQESKSQIELPEFESELRQSGLFEETPVKKQRVWNLFDFVISGLIILVIVAILLTIIAR